MNLTFIPSICLSLSLWLEFWWWCNKYHSWYSPLNWGRSTPSWMIRTTSPRICSRPAQLYLRWLNTKRKGFFRQMCLSYASNWVWGLGLENCFDFPIQIDNFKYETVMIEMTLWIWDLDKNRKCQCGYKVYRQFGPEWKIAVFDFSGDLHWLSFTNNI